MTSLLVLALMTALFMTVALVVSTIERVAKTPGNDSFVPIILILWFVLTIILILVGFGTGNIGVWAR